MGQKVGGMTQIASLGQSPDLHNLQERLPGNLCFDEFGQKGE